MFSHLNIALNRQSDHRLHWLIFSISLVAILVGLTVDLPFISTLPVLLLLLSWFFERSVWAVGIYLLSFSVSMPLFELAVGVHLDDFLLPLVLLIWFGRKVFLDESLFEKTDIGKHLVFFLVVAATFTFLNFHRLTSREMLVSSFAVVRLLEFTIPFFVITSLIRSERDSITLLWIAVVGSIWVTLYGIYQWMDGRQVVVSTLSPNHLHIGVYLVLMFFLSLGLLYSEVRTSRKLLLTLVLVLQFIVLIGSNSRAAWLGFLIGAITFVILKKRKSLIVILLVVIPLGFIYNSLPPTALGRLGQTAQVGYQGVSFDLSTFGRFYIWYGTIQMIFSSLKNFLFGVGLGAFSSASLPFVSLLPGGASGAHNNFLHFFAELGIVGLVAFVSLLFKLAKAARKAIRKSITPFQENLTIGYLSSLVGLIVTCFTQETFSVQEASSSFLAFFFVISGIVLHSMFGNDSLQK